MLAPLDSIETYNEDFDLENISFWCSSYSRNSNINIRIDLSFNWPAAIELQDIDNPTIILNPIKMKEIWYNKESIFMDLFHEIEHFFEESKMKSTPYGKRFAQAREDRLKAAGKKMKALFDLENVFRDCFVDDQVISPQKVPVLRPVLKKQFTTSLFPSTDFTKMPLHAQFKTAIIREYRVPEERCIIDPKVRVLIERLKRNNAIFEATTWSLEKRIEKIEQLIEPIYLKLLDEDIENYKKNKQENKWQSWDPQSWDGAQDWQPQEWGEPKGSNDNNENKPKSWGDDNRNSSKDSENWTQQDSWNIKQEWWQPWSEDDWNEWNPDNNNNQSWDDWWKQSSSPQANWNLKWQKKPNASETKNPSSPWDDSMIKWVNNWEKDPNVNDWKSLWESLIDAIKDKFNKLIWWDLDNNVDSETDSVNSESSMPWDADKDINSDIDWEAKPDDDQTWDEADLDKPDNIWNNTKDSTQQLSSSSIDWWQDDSEVDQDDLGKNPFDEYYKDPRKLNFQKLEDILWKDNLEKLKKAALESASKPAKTTEQLELENRAKSMWLDPKSQKFKDAVIKLKKYENFIKQLENLKNPETHESVLEEILSLFEKIRSRRLKPKYKSRWPVDMEHWQRLDAASLAEWVAQLESGNFDPFMFEEDVIDLKEKEFVWKFELTIITDWSSSMQENWKTMHQKIACLLIFEALKLLHDKLESEVYDMKSPIEFTTAWLMFDGSGLRQLKEPSSDFTDSERIDCYDKLDYNSWLRTNDYDAIDHMINEVKSRWQEYVDELLAGKTKNIVMVLTDWDSSWKIALKNKLKELRELGVIVYWVWISNTALSTEINYASFDPELWEGKVCEDPSLLWVRMEEFLIHHLEKL